jgi:hypothetical protein
MKISLATLLALDKKHHIGVRSEEIDYVLQTSRLFGVGNTEEQAAKTISQLLADYRMNPLKKEAKAVVASATAKTNCPLCGKEYKQISVTASRKGLYCPDHKVVMPVGSED